MRLFFALPLPKPVRLQLWAWGQVLVPQTSGFRWSLETNYHITMAFLGENPPEALEKLEGIGAAIAMASTPLRLSLAPAGTFPPTGEPRVLWAGVTPEDQLQKMAAGLGSALDSIGQNRDRQPFRPHITLARANRRGFLPPLPALPDLPPFEVKTLILFESSNQGQGIIYRELASWPVGRQPELGTPGSFEV